MFHCSWAELINEIRLTIERMRWRLHKDTPVILWAMSNTRTGRMDEKVHQDKSLEWWTREMIHDLSLRYGNQNKYGVTRNSTAAMRLMQALWKRIEAHRVEEAKKDKERLAQQKQREADEPIMCIVQYDEPDF